jgi:hypothetical protein
MNVRSEILEQFQQVAHEQDTRLGPLSDELPLLDSGDKLEPRKNFALEELL